MSEVKIFKLTTGEELIARKEGNVEDDILVNQPLVLIQVQTNSKDTMGAALVPWLVSANPDNLIKLSPEHIVAETTPRNDVEKNYLEKITGLTL